MSPHPMAQSGRHKLNHACFVPLCVSFYDFTFVICLSVYVSCVRLPYENIISTSSLFN